jgi:hypothetical protein
MPIGPWRSLQPYNDQNVRYYVMKKSSRCLLPISLEVGNRNSGGYWFIVEEHSSVVGFLKNLDCPLVCVGREGICTIKDLPGTFGVAQVSEIIHKQWG